MGASSSSKRVRRVVPQARVIEQLISARRSSIASLSQSKAIEDFIAEVAKDLGVGDFYDPLYCCFITRFTRACRHDRDPVIVRKHRVTVGDHRVCGVLFGRYVAVAALSGTIIAGSLPKNSSALTWQEVQAGIFSFAAATTYINPAYGLTATNNDAFNATSPLARSITGTLSPAQST